MDSVRLYETVGLGMAPAARRAERASATPAAAAVTEPRACRARSRAWFREIESPGAWSARATHSRIIGLLPSGSRADCRGGRA